MPSVVRKLQSLAWFLRRPSLYPELARELRHELRRALRAHDDEVGCEAWCAQRAVDAATAIEQLTGAAPEQDVRERFAAELEAAAGRVRAARAAERRRVPPAGPGDMNLLYWLAERSRAERVVETGVAFGFSSLALLLSLSGRPSARLVSTDIPLAQTRGVYVGSAVPDRLRAQWTLLEGPDRRELPRALAQLGSIDLCHYDSDKTYAGRAWAYELLWSRLEAGGLLISDDVADNAAFADFCARCGVQPVVVAGADKYVGVLVKPS